VDLANPRNWRTRSSVHVVMGGTRVQVDAAQEFRLQCVREDIRAMDVFILTHGHATTFWGWTTCGGFATSGRTGCCRYTARQRGWSGCGGLPVCDRRAAGGEGLSVFQAAEMPAKLELPGGNVYSARLPHGSVEVLGLVFEEAGSGKKFAYFCDCKEVTPEARALARGAEVVALDGLRRSGIRRT